MAGCFRSLPLVLGKIAEYFRYMSCVYMCMYAHGFLFVRVCMWYLLLQIYDDCISILTSQFFIHNIIIRGFIVSFRWTVLLFQ